MPLLSLMNSRHRSVKPPLSPYLDFTSINQDNITYYSPSGKWNTLGAFDMDVSFMMKDVDQASQTVFSYYRSATGRIEIIVEDGLLKIQVLSTSVSYLDYQTPIEKGILTTVSVLNSIYKVNGIQVADLTANAGVGINVLTDTWAFGQRIAQPISTSSNVYLKSYSVNSFVFPLNNGIDYTFYDTTLVEESTGSTINAQGLTYWNNNVRN